MSDDDIRRLDDTSLLLQRQAAADCGDEKRLVALDVEVIRRTALIRAQLGGGGEHRIVLAPGRRGFGGPGGRHQSGQRTQRGPGAGMAVKAAQ